jgi:hypothetical protein
VGNVRIGDLMPMVPVNSVVNSVVADVGMHHHCEQNRTGKVPF